MGLMMRHDAGPMIDRTRVLFRSPRKRGRIMVLLSGRGSNFLAIHDAMRAGTIDAEIALVFSNKEDAPGLAAARERGPGNDVPQPQALSRQAGIRRGDHP